jgi:hypothetical protein
VAAQQSGVFDQLESIWPAPQSGPSTAHYLLLAAFHRICDPGPKTEVADWCDTVLESLWQLPAERFTSQAFWDCFANDGAQVDLASDLPILLRIWLSFSRQSSFFRSSDSRRSDCVTLARLVVKLCICSLKKETIKPTIAKSRAVRKLDQKRATSFTERGTTLGLGAFTRSRLTASRGRPRPMGPR